MQPWSKRISASGDTMLELVNVDSFYGNVQALRAVTLSIPDGSIVALLGPNGSGKSTLVKTISALVAARAGQIVFEGERIERLSPDKIVRRGIAHVPQGRQLFLGLTVMENLQMGAYVRSDSVAVKTDIARILELFPHLADRARMLAATLSGGEQQMLAIARALLSRPKLLLMDEPSIGLAPSMIDRVFEQIVELNGRGITVLVVEQNVASALAVSQLTYIMESGRIVLSGNSADLSNDDRIQKLYMGAGSSVAEAIA
jgi:branched-chain amino acid transport system ATP-binding protein